MPRTLLRLLDQPSQVGVQLTSPAGADHRRHALREERVREPDLLRCDLEDACGDRTVDPLADPFRFL